jgi:hypothetical protein
MIILGIAIGLLVGLFGPALAFNIYTYFQVRKLRKTVIPSKVDMHKLCKGAHSWIKTVVLTDEGQVDKQLCRICGFVSGTDLMASQEAIDRIEDQNLMREVEAGLYNDFLGKENVQIQEFFGNEIKGGLDASKLGKVHTAGMTFGARFSIYKVAKEEEKRKELTKGNS